MFFLAFQRVFLQLFLDIAYFPLWWYTHGLGKVIVGLFHQLQDGNHSLAPGLWLRNIFTPMYGQTDIQGRLMSIFMRLVNVIGRSIALFFLLVVLLLFLGLWIVLPIVFGYMIIHVLLSQ